MIGPEAGVGIPRTGRPIAVKDLDEPDSALRQPAGRQELLAERPRDVVVESVETLGRRTLRLELENLGHRRLHPEGQFVRIDPARSFGSSGYSTAADG